PKAEALAKILRRLATTPVDLRRRAERADRPQLHVEPALVLARNEALDGNPVRECLLELARDVAAPTGDALQHDRSRAGSVVHDRCLDLVAFLEPDLAGIGVAELVHVDRGLGLTADGDECRGGSDGDHATTDDVAGRNRALA